MTTGYICVNMTFAEFQVSTFAELQVSQRTVATLHVKQIASFKSRNGHLRSFKSHNWHLRLSSQTWRVFSQRTFAEFLVNQIATFKSQWHEYQSNDIIAVLANKVSPAEFAKITSKQSQSCGIYQNGIICVFLMTRVPIQWHHCCIGEQSKSCGIRQDHNICVFLMTRVPIQWHHRCIGKPSLSCGTDQNVNISLGISMILCYKASTCQYFLLNFNAFVSSTRIWSEWPNDVYDICARTRWRYDISRYLCANAVAIRYFTVSLRIGNRYQRYLVWARYWPRGFHLHRPAFENAMFK